MRERKKTRAAKASECSLEDLMLEFDDWEEDMDLWEREDYEGLVRHRAAVLERRPRDPLARVSLAEAHVLAGQPRLAVALLAPVHREKPRFRAATDVLLDALYAQGLSADDYDWVLRPTVQYLDDSVLQACRRLLLPNGRRQPAVELYTELRMTAYLRFTVEELATALAKDQRFAVYGPPGPFAQICLRPRPAF